MITVIERIYVAFGNFVNGEDSGWLLNRSRTLLPLVDVEDVSAVNLVTSEEVNAGAPPEVLARLHR